MSIRAVRIIRQQTNVASLLELNEAMINQPVQRMNNEGKLEYWSSLADVMELIRVCRRNSVNCRTRYILLCFI